MKSLNVNPFNTRVLKIILSTVCLLFSLDSFSKPFIDQTVQAYLKKGNFESKSSLLVLVRYSVTPKQIQRGGETYQKFLMAQTNSFEGKYFSTEADKKTLWIAGGTLLRLSAGQIQRLLNSNEIASVTSAERKAHLIKDPENLNQPVNSLFRLGYTYGLEMIKLPQLNQSYPSLTGKGVQVGIIDTGIDATHPDLAHKLVKYRNFSNLNNQNPYDDHGHGTHVAGTIAGGSFSGRAIGVAPEVRLFIAKAFDSSGNSTDAGLLESLQWMADPDGNSETTDAPRVISNSWNVEGDSFNQLDPENEPFCVVLKNLTLMGIIPVFAAGNDGPTSSSILVPGACPAAVTVGATDDEDQIASFSSRGPVKWKSLSITKPEISAPGRDIQSADPGGDYRYRSGTSMATPHIAGILAVLFQVKPAMTVDEAKAALFHGAQDFGSPGLDNVFGWGRADVFKSAQQQQ